MPSQAKQDQDQRNQQKCKTSTGTTKNLNILLPMSTQSIHIYKYSILVVLTGGLILLLTDSIHILVSHQILLVGHGFVTKECCLQTKKTKLTFFIHREIKLTWGGNPLPYEHFNSWTDSFSPSPWF